ncbi:fatty-acid amide hydrolase [Aspergillus pseudoustus]|uniref:amidase n=1 Tax=Aspergillus pseudoustus TaxID=1810923 RepID=A0ABR4J4I0_9EURO
MDHHADTTPVWQVKAWKKREDCRNKIPKQWLIPETMWENLPLPLAENKVDLIDLDIIRRCNTLTARELDITENHNVALLLEKLATGQFTAVEVTTAFCKRASVAGQLTNCLTETPFDTALTRAQELDLLRESGKLKGPLHGLPISVKDCLQIAGTQATIGFTAYLDQLPSKHNSCLVEMLLDLGAVLYVKTNIPQTLMTADSENVIFGRTLNPYNTMLTAGGSSGGEGALLALRGSPLGIGTDVAGSIRIPALCCGLYGFKPSASRIPDGKQQGYGSGGLRTVYGSVGPLAGDIDALEILTRAVLSARPALYDPGALDIPWREVATEIKPKLRFGFFLEDQAFPLHPPVRDALQDAVSCLRDEGHEIVPLSAEECHMAKALEVIWKFFSFDNSASEVVAQGGEPPIASRAVIASLKKGLGSKFVPDFEEMAPLDRLSTLNIKRGEIIADWHRLWRKYNLDAVICPPAQNTAVEHDQYGLTPYTSFLNLLDYPACVIPFKRAKEYPDFAKEERQCMPYYNGKLLKGAPCSVQVFTSRLRDEECLAIARVVDQCLHKGRARY